MGFWKIVGGICAGIGAVALLPVAGAVGAVALPGALIGGAVGAGIAVATDDDEEKRIKEAKERAAAESAVRSEKMEMAVRESRAAAASAREKARQAAERALQAEQNERAAWLKLEEFTKSLKEPESHYQLIIALTAIGMATASADGCVDECEVKDLDEYISGVASSHLPSKVKARITYLRNHPPTFEKAFAEVKKLENTGSSVPWNKFRQLVLDIINADGIVTKEEKAFLAVWDGRVSGQAALPPSAFEKNPSSATRAISAKSKSQRELVQVLNAQLTKKTASKSSAKRKK